MKKERPFHFSLPMPQKMIKGFTIAYYRNLGDLTIYGVFRSRDDFDIDSVEYNGINVLPILQYEESIGTSPALDEISEAIPQHVESLIFTETHNYNVRSI